MPFDIGHARAPYDEFSQQMSYEFDSGLLVIPVAGPPGTPPKIVRTHSPLGAKTMVFAGQRVGALPKLPDPTPQNANEILLAGHIKPAVPSLSMDGTPVARVEGSFSYVLLQPLTHKDTLPMGSAPYDTTPGGQYAITPSAWSTQWISGASRQTPVVLGPNIIGR